MNASYYSYYSQTPTQLGHCQVLGGVSVLHSCDSADSIRLSPSNGLQGLFLRNDIFFLILFVNVVILIGLTYQATQNI